MKKAKKSFLEVLLRLIGWLMMISALGLACGMFLLKDQIGMNLESHGHAFVVLFFIGVFGVSCLGLIMGVAFLGWARTLAVLTETRTLILAMARRFGADL